MKYLYILLIYFNLFVLCLSCFSRYYCNYNDFKNLETPNVNESVKTLDQKCSFRLINPKRLVSPHRQNLESYVSPKPFGSICVKCAACLAVAWQISAVINDTLKEYSSLGETTYTEVSKSFADLCANGFRNYDFRKINEKYIVTNDLANTEHVSIPIDKSWTNKLREKCYLYITQINIPFVISKSDEVNILNYICRNDGIFRDCYNVNFCDLEENLIITSLTLC